MKGWAAVVSWVTVLVSAGAAIAQANIVVVPLVGKKSTGDAVATDTVAGKTFSNKDDIGLVGALKIRNGSTIYSNTIGMKFSLIPAGSFVMGSPDGTGAVPAWPAEPGRASDETQHVVTLSKSFYLQTTEVTQGQWQQVMGSNPSYFTACGLDCPVERVSWDDAQDFVDALNTREGRTDCNFIPNTCYTLPTESQWEYAARGGTVTAFYSGGITSTDCTLDPNLDAIGWYCGNAGSATHPVAKKVPNNWGLYDMSGNVWEWVEDWFATYPVGPITDPSGPPIGWPARVLRGGSFLHEARYERSALRNSSEPGNSFHTVGFRLAMRSGQ